MTNENENPQTNPLEDYIEEMDGLTAVAPETAIVERLDRAFDVMNARLFGGRLPGVVITLVRKRNAAGYFSPERFRARAGEGKAHEIGMNPDTFGERDSRRILSTLLHEMCHLWQQVEGTTPRRGYHDKQWAAKMREVGLAPFNVDNPKRDVGQKCSHEIVEGGPADALIAELIAAGLTVEYHSQDVITTGATAGGAGAKGPKTKHAYQCPGCECKAWGKPGLNLHCGDCDVDLVDLDAGE